MKKSFWLALIFALSLPLLPAQAQGIAPSEPDSDLFLAENFHLQDHYNRVLCVAGDGTCPAEITVAVPCLTATCTHAALPYAITENFETIQAAADATQPGDLVIITPGHYAGVQVEENGGSDGAYIHFLGWGAPGEIVIDGPADPDLSYLRHHFYFINAHHYILQNLTFTAADRGAGIFVSGYFSETGSFAHHFAVLDVYSHDNYSWGLHTTSTSYILIQDSVFTGSADEHGVYLSGSGDHFLIRRNVFQNNNASGLQINADPLTASAELFYWLSNSTGDTCDLSEDDPWHEIKACYDRQNLPDLGEFIEDGISQDIIIEGNIITGNGAAGGAGINLASVRETTVRNNLIYGNDAAAIACWDDGYAEWHSLDPALFGCNVFINNNTLVDASGGRGALILNNDAGGIAVYNNIIVRGDRADAYEVTNNAAVNLYSGHNYFSTQMIEDPAGFAGEENSITGFSIDEALAQFVNAGFAPWLLEDGVYPALNPGRPDYHPLADSVLARDADARFAPTLDAMGDPRSGFEIGALAAAATVNATEDTASAPKDVLPGKVTYALDGSLYLMEIDGPTRNISAELDSFSSGSDVWINIAPDGDFLVLETERFHPDCNGWACLAVTDAALTAPEVITIDGLPLHVEGFSAIASGGDLVIFPQTDGPHNLDLFATSRVDGAWTAPVLLTGGSVYEWNSTPAISDDGTKILFNCGYEPYGGDGAAICEVNTDGSDFHYKFSPEIALVGFPVGCGLNHADYAPDGRVVFEGDCDGEQIWRLTPGETLPSLVSPAYSNDNSPCVLPDGRIVSLWLDRDGGPGFHELKLMQPDGTGNVMLLQDADISDYGTGCGG